METGDLVGLNTKMYSFYKDYAGKLRFQSNYQTKKATSSDSTKVTVSANSSATKVPIASM